MVTPDHVALGNWWETDRGRPRDHRGRTVGGCSAGNGAWGRVGATAATVLDCPTMVARSIDEVLAELARAPDAPVRARFGDVTVEVRRVPDNSVGVPKGEPSAVASDENPLVRYLDEMSESDGAVLEGLAAMDRNRAEPESR